MSSVLDMNLKAAPKFAPPPARISVVETVYHQPLDGGPTSSEVRFQRILKTDEQPFSRRVLLEESKGWVALERGWIEHASMLLVRNDEDPRKSQAIVEVGMMVNRNEGESRWHVAFASILPGESVRFTPNDLSLLSLRGMCGNAKVYLTLMPE